MRDRLVDLATDGFQLGVTLDERVFLVDNDGRNVALFGPKAKSALAAAMRQRSGESPGRTNLDEAWQIIEGLAQDVPKRRLPFRVAPFNGGSVLDLGDVEGRAVIIDATGWHQVERSPITFKRTGAMVELPIPVAGGTLEALWSILNIRPDQRHLFAAWMASVLIPDIPHPIPLLRGEQGSAKSTCARIMGQLVDPSTALVVSPPKDQERWTASAASRWVLPVDNVSTIPVWWSDDLCRAVTGAGIEKRKLYSDDDVIAIDIKTCVILNGISLSSAMRSDLAERVIPFDLLRPAAYKTEAQLAEAFTAMHPEVLGALLDLAVGILACRTTVEAPTDLRMADAAHLFACYDHHLSLGPGDGAVAAYRAHISEAFEEAFDDDALAQAVVDFMVDRDEWEGRAADLHAQLTLQHNFRCLEGERSDRSFWPGSPSRLMQVLPRSSPLFTRKGIKWTDQGRRNDGRHVRLERIRASADAPPARAPEQE